jgi:(p)ppGpp synthase/HD superfamily hydrolase
MTKQPFTGRAAGALAFATVAHRNQRRLGGEPYIMHPIAVAQSLERAGESAQVVALLHDVLEDCGDEVIVNARVQADGYTYELIIQAQEEGMVLSISVLLRRDEMHALWLVSRSPDERYTAFIARAAQQSLSRLVTIADIYHNLSTLPDDRDSLRDRYTKALTLLEDADRD